jgi:uroporphyrinogen III methyltransferase / synthase
MNTEKHKKHGYLPLAGKRIVITRSRDQASDMVRLLSDCGAIPVEFPTIEVVPPADWAGLDEAINRISTFDWVVFTSVNAVKFFIERFDTLGLDRSLLNGIHICAVGPRTEESLTRIALKSDLIPAEYTAEGVLEVFGSRDIAGRNILIPRAQEAREIIPDGLKNMGAHVTVATAYKNVRPAANSSEVMSLFVQKKIDVVTFTSSSTVRNFVEILGKKGYKTLLEDAVLACIGPVTAKTAGQYGLKADIVPNEYTIQALVDAIKDYFNNKDENP